MRRRWGSDRAQVLGVAIYAEHLYRWFHEGGKRGRGALTAKELQEKAYRDLSPHFGEGDYDEIDTGFGVVLKWQNQLAFALVQARNAGEIVKKGTYCYHQTRERGTPVLYRDA
jgi:hypothetical protein